MSLQRYTTNTVFTDRLQIMNCYSLGEAHLRGEVTCRAALMDTCVAKQSLPNMLRVQAV